MKTCEGPAMRNGGSNEGKTLTLAGIEMMQQTSDEENSISEGGQEREIAENKVCNRTDTYVNS